MFSEFRKQKDIELVINLDELEKYGHPNNKAVKVVKDKRSYVAQVRGAEYYHVYPVGYCDVHVYIVCPHCGDIHLHGRGDGDGEGHRVSHCTPTHKRSCGSHCDCEKELLNNNGYIILRRA